MDDQERMELRPKYGKAASKMISWCLSIIWSRCLRVTVGEGRTAGWSGRFNRGGRARLGFCEENQSTSILEICYLGGDSCIIHAMKSWQSALRHEWVRDRKCLLLVEPNDPRNKTAFQTGVPSAWLFSTHGWRVGPVMLFHPGSSLTAVPFRSATHKMPQNNIWTSKPNIFQHLH